VVWAGTESAEFEVGAPSTDMIILLAFVAIDRFTDVFTDSDLVAKNENVFLEKGVSLFQGVADNLERGKGLVDGPVVNTFDLVGLGHSSEDEAVLLLDEGQVVRVGWVEIIFAVCEFEDNWVFFELVEC